MRISSRVKNKAQEKLTIMKKRRASWFSRSFGQTSRPSSGNLLKIRIVNQPTKPTRSSFFPCCFFIVVYFNCFKNSRILIVVISYRSFNKTMALHVRYTFSVSKTIDGHVK